MRILVVEDQPDMRRLLTEMLDEEGYSVDTSADGLNGLGKALSCDYDAVVLDLMLPKLNGFEFLQRLRRMKKTPVLILSAKDQTRDRVQGLDEGADDYLNKPFERAELLARMRALIRRSSGIATSVLLVKEVEIDFRARSVRYMNEESMLTAKEFSLLEYLVLKRGKVISRMELYEHLFDEIDESYSNVLDVYVSNLRKKIRPDLIETRRGMGYVIP